MAALRSHQFWSGAAVSTAFVTRYTVPTGFTIILKSVAMRNGSATAGKGWIRTAGVTIFTHLLSAAGNDGASFEWRPWIVLTEGQTIDVAADSGLTINMVISGSILYN
jgi:hypothetical protein